MLNGLADWLFAPSGLTPHGFCLLWRPGLIWTYAMSDIGIALAYFSIPVALGMFARRRRDLVFRPIFWLFAAFILLCGSTHWLDVLTLWVPVYGIEAAVKAVTATVSLVTAAVLWRLLPQALALPSSRQLQDLNTALARSEARHRASFERSPVPLYTVDDADIVTAVSDSWLSLLGYSAAEVIGRHIGAFRAPQSAPFTDADRDRLMRHGELPDQPRHFRCRDGSVIEAVVSARVDRHDEGCSIVCVLIDVTARRAAEAALRVSEERLRQSQKMEAVGQLTGGIAHDFNNMLQGIVGCLDRMDGLCAKGRAAEVPPYIAIARQSAERAAVLTSRMLAFARRQPLHPRPVEPAKLVGDMGELIRRTIGPSVELTLALRGGGWLALGDANQLESALLNLAINARDAMPSGGTLTVATADRHLSREDLSDQADCAAGDYVEISVTDTGQGMPPDMLPRVFEPFFTTKPIGQGTGLGLSQVYGFVRQSGGFVRLDSSPGRGTSVRLYLPRGAEAAINDGAAGPQPAAEAALGAGPAGRTVLVVDDETGLRSLIAEALQELGCAVLQAASGSVGLDIVQSGQPIDLLITDIGLPGLNGRQLADAARQFRPGLPVLLITGYAGTALDASLVGPGIEVLLKPFGLQAICERTRALLASACSGLAVGS